jgi:3-hydroxyacyl-CoA dehydrogenase
MKPEELEEKMKLITPTTTFDAFKDVDLVIEAVPELIKIKLEIFKELDKVCPESAILATNTSAISISAIASATKRPAQVVGMHFFYPAHIMKLVEVIPGLETSDETAEEIVSFCESLRKIPIKVKECPGFLVNRLLMPYLNEAVVALQEGAVMPDGRVAGIVEIDAAMKEQGWPMGPFTLIDALGMDICAEAGKVLWEGYGDRMRPALIWEQILKAKRLGRKGGKGFYDYSGAATNAPGTPDPELQKMIAEVQQKTGIKGTRFSPDRLMSIIINEAVLALQENISSASEIEMGVLAGLGYPPSKGGLLHAADGVGIDALVDNLLQWTKELGFRFHPAYRLRTMRAAGHLGVKTKKGFFTYA